MVERDDSTIRAVAWWEVFPWLNVVRIFRISIAARALVLGALGILIMVTGWGIVGRIFNTESEATGWLAPMAEDPWTTAIDPVHDRPTKIMSLLSPGLEDPNAARDQLFMRRDPVRDTWTFLSLPAWVALANTNRSIPDVVAILLCGLVGVAVWGFFGAAICRMAAVQLAAGEQVGMGAALRFACRKWPACCAAPLLPVGGVLLASIPVWVLGLIMKLNAGLLLGGLVWPLALAAGLVMVLLLLGLLFGWPLMWATISAEGTDSFDALSRSYAYIFQRPLHYLFYVLVAGFIGWLGWLLVQGFAEGVVWMAYWAAGWGCGAAQIDAIINNKDLEGAAWLGALLIRVFAGCVKLLAIGYVYSYFWTAVTAIYFLLRRDVDATEMDEVYLDADATEQPAALPTIATDQAGAPEVKEETKSEG
jgi:hypothetical protein